jgi:hypothetical protein
MRLPLLKRTVVAVTAPQSGLGNRIRVLLGAKSLAESEGRELAYVWPTGPSFGPRLPELWRFDATVMPPIVSRAIAPIWPYRDHTLTWIDDDCRKRVVWQIAARHALQLPVTATPWQAHLRLLAPVGRIADAVTVFFDEHLRGRPYVGVMIRAHARAHRKTRAASPLEWYVARMRALASEHPGIRFFVSSDVAEAANAVAASVPDVVTRHDKGAYNSVRGVQSAVADLYLLASASYILGPYWSSFAETARYLSGGTVTLEDSRAGSGTGALLQSLATDPLHPWCR